MSQLRMCVKVSKRLKQRALICDIIIKQKAGRKVNNDGRNAFRRPICKFCYLKGNVLICEYINLSNTICAFFPHECFLYKTNTLYTATRHINIKSRRKELTCARARKK
eukprot:201319_1